MLWTGSTAKRGFRMPKEIGQTSYLLFARTSQLSTEENYGVIIVRLVSPSSTVTQLKHHFPQVYYNGDNVREKLFFWLSSHIPFHHREWAHWDSP